MQPTRLKWTEKVELASVSNSIEITSDVEDEVSVLHMRTEPYVHKERLL